LIGDVLLLTGFLSSYTGPFNQAFRTKLLHSWQRVARVRLRYLTAWIPLRRCRLIGDVLLLTGFLSYTGPFNQEFRTKLLYSWQRELRQRRVPYTVDLPLISSLVDNTTIGEWNLQVQSARQYSLRLSASISQEPGARFTK